MYNFFKKLFKKKEKYVPQKADIAKNLIEAKDILNSINIKSWLNNGSLLGYAREGDIIAHDHDGDLGVFIENYSDEIIPEFIKNGWTLRYVWGTKDSGLELTFIKNQVDVDLFFFYHEGERCWSGSWYRRDKTKNYYFHKYYYDYFELKEVEFLNSNFLVPVNAEKYLAGQYGPDWKIPKRIWDGRLGPLNVVETDFYLKFNKKRVVR